MKTLIHNARFAGDERPDAWVLIEGAKIAAAGNGSELPEADERIDAEGALVMPGAIDCHVHFREPGLTHKADIRSESQAAVAGGVTSFLEMPNTKPPTTTAEAWQQKFKIAERESAANFAFFIGATNDNIQFLKDADYTKIPGVKLFMGSSTGNMLVDNQDAISQIFSQVDAIVAVHAESQPIICANTEAMKAAYPNEVPIALHSAIRSEEACYQSTKQAIELAKKHNRRLHVCHLSTARELELLGDELITSEVSPHHLLWCDEDYSWQGTRIKMNPAVKSRKDRDALRNALKSGLIDIVATDHAPHLLSEKQGDALTAVSGAPMVQFSLPVMLSLFEEKLVQRTMCERPAEIFGIKDRGRLAPGYYADIVIVRATEPYRVDDNMVLSKCAWTPLAGMRLRHKVEKTWVNGSLAYPYGHNAAMPLVFKKP